MLVVRWFPSPGVASRVRLLKARTSLAINGHQPSLPTSDRRTLGSHRSCASLPMDRAPANRRFGVAWLLFAIALALHITDEATHDFLTTYNASVQAVRARLPFLPLPTFTPPVWLAGLIAGILLLLCFSPLAFRGNRLLRLIAFPLAVLVGVFNAALHISSSFYLHRWMPGVYSSPLLLAAALFLLYSARRARPPGSTAPGLPIRSEK